VAAMDPRFRTALWALAGLALAIGISMTAFAVAGGSISQPAGSVRVTPAADELRPEQSPKPSKSSTPSESDKPSGASGRPSSTSTPTAPPSETGDDGGSGSDDAAGTHDGNDD
jgi:hypothetical protein